VKNRLFIIFSITFALIFNPLIQSSFAEVKLVDDGWITPDWPVKGNLNVTFQDRVKGAGSPYLIKGEYICSSLTDSKCSDPQKPFEYLTRLSPCLTAEDLDCIENIIASIDSKTVTAKFVDTFPKKVPSTYINDVKKFLPKAGSGSIYELNDIQNSKGNKYFVNIVSMGSMHNTEKEFTPTSLSISISGINLVAIKERRGIDGIIDDGSGSLIENVDEFGKTILGAKGLYGPYEDEQVDCVMSGDFLCANRSAMLDDLKFQVVLRLSKSPSGWFHGRISNPEILIERINTSSSVRLSISGSNMRVPAVGLSKKWETVPKDLQDKYLKGGFAGNSLGCRWCSSNPLEATTVSSPLPSGQGSIDEFKAWLPLINDQSSADLNTWSVRTLEKQEMNGADKCFVNKTQLNGLVVSNSTVYSAGPPKFDGSSLNYQVAAPHFMSDGSVKRGIYTLLVRSDVARCVYGFSSAPITASVSVVNDKGINTVATTTVSEKNNWLQLSAYNFEFSSPTIKIKINQNKNLKGTISCIKGKTTKKITAKNPKCPVGFKMKTN
jgi:hypothetical protein